MTYKCFECQMQHPNHKMDCGSKSRCEALQWLLASLQYLPDELLYEVYSKVWFEISDRRFKDMFDDEEGEQ